LLQGEPALEARDEGADGERSGHARASFLLRAFGERFTCLV
jgi:hypothetical protein